MTLFTIGYGGRKPAAFIALLRDHSVRAVADVRIWPHRASMGVWVKANSPDKGIQKLLTDAGIEYHSLPELGNPFIGYPDWPERYRQFFDRAGDLLVTRLVDVPQPYCLLCAEKKATECHRRLIADFLVRTQGIVVHHLE